MITAIFLYTLHQKGVRLSVNGEQLSLKTPRGVLTETDRLIIQAGKAEILALLANFPTAFAAYYAEANEEDKVWLAERAAIIEYDGKLSRSEAEEQALHQFIKHRYP